MSTYEHFTSLGVAITPNDVSRRLTPKINAAGRVGDPMISVQLMQERENKRCLQLAEVLEKYNRKRRQAERRAFREALHMAKEEMRQHSPGALVLVGKDWHPGIIGLLATKVTKEFDRPAIILSNDGHTDELLGSGRSRPNDNILDILVQCDDLLNSYGGHPMAVGVSLAAKNFQAFKNRFLSYFRPPVQMANSEAIKLFADGQVQLNELDSIFFEQYEKFEPFGSGNNEPIYYIDNLYPEAVNLFGENHSRGFLRDNTDTSISFVAYTRPPEDLPPAPWEIMASPRIVSIGGRLTQQLLIHDLRAK